MNICAMCGKPAECTHHLIFGQAYRKLADQDGLTIRLCNNCHNMGKRSEKIHENTAAELLSKMLGQAIWERDEMARILCDTLYDTDAEPEAKEILYTCVTNKFIKRYGRNWL